MCISILLNDRVSPSSACIIQTLIVDVLIQLQLGKTAKYQITFSSVEKTGQLSHSPPQVHWVWTLGPGSTSLQTWTSIQVQFRLNLGFPGSEPDCGQSTTW